MTDRPRKELAKARAWTRKLTASEKFTLESETLAKEKPRNPNHMVIVTVQDETDDHGNPIVTVLRMRDAGRRKGST